MSNTSESHKQTRETARIASEIRKRKRRGKTYSKIALELGILTRSGGPDPGLVYKIGFEGYEPKRPETRERLGLKKMCLTCLRGFRKVSRRVRDLPPWRAWWSRLKPADRDRKIREYYEKERE